MKCSSIVSFGGETNHFIEGLDVKMPVSCPHPMIFYVYKSFNEQHCIRMDQLSRLCDKPIAHMKNLWEKHGVAMIVINELKAEHLRKIGFAGYSF